VAGFASVLLMIRGHLVHTEPYLSCRCKEFGSGHPKMVDRDAKGHPFSVVFIESLPVPGSERAERP
jgi:hypothetical protein